MSLPAASPSSSKSLAARAGGGLRRRTRYVLGALLALLVVVYFGLGAVVSLKLARARRSFDPERSPATQQLAYTDVRFPARGGDAQLAGWYVQHAAGRHVLVIVHGKDSSRTREHSGRTAELMARLYRRGFALLAIDLRGHGQSKLFPDGSTKDLCSGGGDALFAGMVSDVKAAVGYARTTLGAQSVAVIGASIGSNSALVAFSEDAQLAMVVALSPGLDYLGIKTDGAVRQLGSRPALLEAADDDSYSAGSVRQLQALNSALTTKIWPSGGHANQLLTSHPEELPRLAELVTAALGK